MKEIILSPAVAARMEKLYQDMETAYNDVAVQLDFTCTGCPDNCCDSYFLHHTYAEWAYLWLGFSELSIERQEEIMTRCHDYNQAAKDAIDRDERPQIMCPLNDNGLCSLYKHRLLVCRTHGVPAVMTRPDGQQLAFPGCFRCQEIVQEKYGDITPPQVERTPGLRQLVMLENELLDNRRHVYPKIKLTIAQMLTNGPPTIPSCKA